MRRQLTIKDQLSKKSCGILYHLKSNLERRNTTLNGFICDVFGYEKTKFTRPQFQKVIKKYDENLVYDEIDQLFNELDDSKNDWVFLYKLKQAYDEINESDNPIDKSRSIFKAKIINLFKEPTLEQVKAQVKSILLESEDVFQIIDLFAIQKSGYLSVQNVIEILKNFEYESQKKRIILLQYLFQNKSRISVETFIAKLQLNSIGRRVNINKLDLSRIQQKSMMMEDSIEEGLKSQFMKQKLRQSSRMQESVLSLDLRTLRSTQQFIRIDQIPDCLQPYFNYGSVLEPQFGNIACEYIQTNQFFIDTENPTYNKAYQFVHFAEIKGDHYSLFAVSQSVLHRDKNRKGLGQLLQSKDIIQGALGDCYFMSAISAIVERYPELAYRLFVLDKNPSHLYGIRLFINGVWKTILVDACFPIDKRGVFCAAQPYKNQIWVMLLEKAWAKVFGSYDNIHAGYNQQGLNAMSGAPSIHSSSRQQGFLKKLQVHLKRGAIITCATSADVQQMTDKQQDQLGIYSNHAYTLQSVFSNLPYQQRLITLIKIRNPWGRKQWKGDWGYYSSTWTKQLKDIMNYNINPQDGSFFMSYQNFMMYFDFVNICQVNLSYINSYLTFQSDRNEYNILTFKITQRGDYFFTQYQDNPRKYKNSFNYQKSKSWMYLLQRTKDNNRIAIGSKTTQYKDNTLQATLQQGQYILISKTSWKYWQKHASTITSYGPSKVEFVLDKSNKYNPINQLSNYISLKSQIGLGKISKYDRIHAEKRLYMDATEGYGFLVVNNFENKVLKTQITMNPCKGITILPPYYLPMTLEIFPSQSVIVKFVVDPSGYAYQYGERYVLY